MKWMRKLFGGKDDPPEPDDDGAGMDEDTFWALIEAIRAESGDDLERRETLMKERVAALPLSELRDFAGHWTHATDRAYDWRLWGAAYVIRGGCSDDSFMDFRDTLVSFGRETFEAALGDPETLLPLAERFGDGLAHEGFGYVTFAPWKKKTGEDTPPRAQPNPGDPTGEAWDEDDLPLIVPALWKRFGEA